MSGLLKIVAIGVSEEERHLLSAILSVPVMEANELQLSPVDHDSRKALIFADLDRGQLATLIAQGFDIHVEWAGPAPTASILRRETEAQLVISMTTRSAFQSLTGTIVARMLVAHGLLQPPSAENIANAVQESIANAVIHGNLGMRLDATDPEVDFLAFHEEVARRASGPTGILHRVTIRAFWTESDISIAVGDEGAGFIAPPEAIPTATDLSGRGMMIMRAQASKIAFDDNGRVTVMTFARPRS